MALVGFGVLTMRCYSGPRKIHMSLCVSLASILSIPKCLMGTVKHSRYLELAKRESLKSDHKSHKIGCVIVRGYQVLGTGYNLYKTHTKSPHPYKSIHAEFMACINAGFDVAGATVYVFRAYKDGEWALARPCPHCFKYLKDIGIVKVVYSDHYSFKEEMV